MSGVVFTVSGVLGVWLLVTGRAGAGGSRRPTSGPRSAGLSTRGRRVPLRRVARAVPGALIAGAAGWLATWALVGGVAAPAVAALFCGALPARAASSRRRQRIAAARHAWPRLLAETRVLAEQGGQSIPTAFFAAGAAAPPQMQHAFSEAARTWALSTDFELSLRVLKDALADPIADAVCETLLAAHQIGGVHLDSRLRALSEAAQAESAALADARAKQAGARFARGFVAAVPAFMALIGLSIGRGREAYLSPSGQLLVAFSVLAVAGCWVWAGRIMAIPPPIRVFAR